LTEWRPGPIPHTVFDQPCLDFVNSEFTDHKGGGTRYDRLQMVAWRRWFLDRWSFTAPSRPTPETMRRLEAFRSLMRQLLESRAHPAGSQVRRLNQLLAANPVVWRLNSVPVKKRGQMLAMQLQPVVDGWDAVIAGVVASYAELSVSGDLARVKRCGNPHCQFIFFDGSANRTRRWCDPALCGNLVKVRAFRARDRRQSNPVRRPGATRSRAAARTSEGARSPLQA
jgi:predicted RNA-binding Zn ribbon-like protein